MKTPKLETERLILREVQAEDTLEIFQCWMRDEEVSRYMWWKASDDIAEAEGFIAFELEQVDNPKWKRWMLTEKESGKIVGTCLVYWNDDDEPAHWDISYNLGRAYWGRGLVTEAMRVVMDWAKGELGMQECVTSYAKVNENSAKVLHKLGFRDERTISYPCSGGEFVTEGVECRWKA